MPEAVLKNGVIQPLEPLPAEWRDGQRLLIEPIPGDDWHEPTQEQFEHSMRVLEEMCADSDPEDERRLTEALAVMKRESKEHMRRLMGLSDG